MSRWAIRRRSGGGESAQLTIATRLSFADKYANLLSGWRYSFARRQIFEGVRYRNGRTDLTRLSGIRGYHWIRKLRSAGEFEAPGDLSS